MNKAAETLETAALNGLAKAAEWELKRRLWKWPPSCVGIFYQPKWQDVKGKTGKGE